MKVLTDIDIKETRKGVWEQVDQRLWNDCYNFCCYDVRTYIWSPMLDIFQSLLTDIKNKLRTRQCNVLYEYSNRK